MPLFKIPKMFKVFENNCENCLLSRDRIVSPQRAKQIIEGCKQQQTYFICHKSDDESGDVCCRKFFDKLGHYSQMIRIAERLNAVEFIDRKENKRLTPYADQK